MKSLTVALFTLSCGFNVAHAMQATLAPPAEPPVQVPCWERSSSSESSTPSVPPRRCAVLQGEDSERDEFAQFARTVVEILPSDGDAIDVLHSVAGWTSPAVRTPAGIEIVTIQAENEIPRCASAEGATASETSEHPLPELAQAAARLAKENAGPSPLYAWVSLSPPFASYCGVDALWLGAGDALGGFGRILRIDPRGLLVLHDETLVWLPSPQSPPPVFRMTWRSGFIVQMEQSGGGAATSSTSKSASKSDNKSPPTALKARTAPRNKKKQSKVK